MSHVHCLRFCLASIAMASFCAIMSSTVLAQQPSGPKSIKPVTGTPASKPSDTKPPEDKPSNTKPSDAKPSATLSSEVSADHKLNELDKAILKATDQLIGAFNDANVDQILRSFVSDGELIDEHGNVYQGHEAIGAVAKSFFEKYPKTHSFAELDSVRKVSDLVFADGTRIVTAKDGKVATSLRFTSIWKKTNEGYQLISLRDFADNIVIAPHEGLEPLAWLIGEWVNEGAGTKVAMNYKWSEDENFIIGELHVLRDGKTDSKSSQRIAWDASQGVIRSWTFDSDGGFGEAVWVESEKGWIMESSASSPDGQKGSAIVTIVPVDAGRYKMIGTNRVIGNSIEPDFEITVVKKPPQADK